MLVEKMLAEQQKAGRLETDAGEMKSELKMLKNRNNLLQQQIEQFHEEKTSQFSEIEEQIEVLV